MEESIVDDLPKNIVGLKFKKQGKIYTFEAADLILKPNDKVIVETENGLTVAVVATGVRQAQAGQFPPNLKKIVRKVTPQDLKADEENRKTEKNAFDFCFSRIAERNLAMKLVEVECLFARSKIIFYFTADNRVDFRELVKDLVQKFKTRIELRQIGVRNETRICGGMGICGREICCSTFLQNLDTVSVKMAKEQNMLLNPEKISGLCGRLMCCLAFEYETYRDMKKNMPKIGKISETPLGRGKVVRQNILKGTISVHMEDGREVELEIKPPKEEKKTKDQG
jgi:cell fate regulator YaaT (PSP1 superfamily)